MLSGPRASDEIQIAAISPIAACAYSFVRPDTPLVLRLVTFR